MNKKDKFFMLLALSCLPLSEMAAEQVDGMAVSPISQELLQNSVKITGKVVDVQGEPVIGATVMEKGTTNGIITDVDGNFTLMFLPTGSCRFRMSVIRLRKLQLAPIVR